jgi:phage I-like protein
MKQGIATAFFEIEQNTEGEIQLTPAGYFRAIDGRPEEPELNQGWLVDEKIAENIINKIAQRKNPLVVDYNHASLIEGHEAPAAGWMPANEFYWNDKGLKAKVEWTERAKTSIANKEHKYISPVFIYDTKTGEIKEIINAALTNTPALDGMAEAALSQFFENQHHEKGEEMTSDVLYTLAMKSDSLFNLCGLSSDATEDQVIEAVQSLLKKIRAAEEAAMAANQKFSNVMETLGVTSEEKVTGAITQLKNKSENAVVPKALLANREATIESLRAEILKGNEINEKLQREAIIKQAQIECKLPEDVDSVEMQYALARPTIADLKDYVEVCKANRPPMTTQTGGISPLTASTSSLSNADPRSVIAAQESRKLAKERGISLEQACVELASLKENM